MLSYGQLVHWRLVAADPIAQLIECEKNNNLVGANGVCYACFSLVSFGWVRIGVRSTT